MVVYLVVRLSLFLSLFLSLSPSVSVSVSVSLSLSLSLSLSINPSNNRPRNARITKLSVYVHACGWVCGWVSECRCDPVLALFSRSPSLTHTCAHFVPSRREQAVFLSVGGLLNTQPRNNVFIVVRFFRNETTKRTNNP